MSKPDGAQATRRADRMPGYLQDVGAAVRRPIGDAWMVTFADLVALMLTFFVLMFAMSQVERYKWHSLVRSLADAMDSIQSVDDAKPAVEFQIDEGTAPPGTDLNYLTPLILRRIATDPALSDGVVQHRADRVVLSLPVDRLFDPKDVRVAARGGPTVYAVGSLLRTLDNRVEVHGHVAPPIGTGDTGEGGADRPRDPAGWGVALGRAATLAAGLAEVGYDRPVVVRGFGEARHDALGADLDDKRRERFNDRIDIVILDQAAGGS